jgi:hypothetical protein
MTSDPRILVALGDGAAVGVPVVFLGMTEATWADIADDKAQDIDLRPLGIPAVLLVMRGRDHEDIKRQLMAATAGVYQGASLADLSVPKPPKD